MFILKWIKYEGEVIMSNLKKSREWIEIEIDFNEANNLTAALTEMLSKIINCGDNLTEGTMVTISGYLCCETQKSSDLFNELLELYQADTKK